jgi:hypothetical protein
MKYVRRMICSVLLLASISPLPASAYTEVQSQIGWLQVLGSGASAPGSYDVRVYLATGGIVCGGYNWAYFNVGDAAYSALLATLLSAKTWGSTVLLDTTPDPGTGYCHLAYVVVK